MKEAPELNPKTVAALLRSFKLGAIGHALSSPCPPQKEPLLQEWLGRHGGETFVDPDCENRVVGVFGCTCAECLPLMRNFVSKAGIALMAQSAGDVTVLRVDDHETKTEVRSRSAYEVAIESRVAELCINLCLSVCEEAATQVAKEIAMQVSAQVAEKVAQRVADTFRVEMRRQMKLNTGAVRRNALIASAGAEQAAMMHHVPPE